MHRMAFLALAACVLAGCASAPPSQPVPAPVTSPGAEVLHFDGSYSVEDYEAGTFVSGYRGVGFQQPGNCILLQGHPVILNGTADATWDAPPGTPSMELGLEDGETYVMSESGAGFTQLRFTDIAFANDGALAWQLSRGAAGGASTGLHAVVHLAFDYTLPDPTQDLVVDPGYSCAVDH